MKTCKRLIVLLLVVSTVATSLQAQAWKGALSSFYYDSNGVSKGHTGYIQGYHQNGQDGKVTGISFTYWKGSGYTNITHTNRFYYRPIAGYSLSFLGVAQWSDGVCRTHGYPQKYSVKNVVYDMDETLLRVQAYLAMRTEADVYSYDDYRSYSANTPIQY